MTPADLDALIERRPAYALTTPMKADAWMDDAVAALVQLRERIAALEAERDALKQDAVWLLQRARAIINRWQELYGEHQPQFLPPAHQIEWAEDASEFIDAAREKP